ncbi:NAD-dependent epimerase/dehydratase family protein [Paenibacillus sp. KQZ6P-2]|uniref:NAD-dependent epimerase/dehydratase family protein n=1 Tax=Paenibacillus mangrovi TaxID=2931978 RepID=A0A9X1WRT2_9BACL|nr:NAD-dependent epimerase/dehydratase family protein [Paenibacillus mangrovi]MCJ8013884.1 NAD-dependent epimerase/dehydratase family protein [Paenibacillus mangrovi]
MTTVVVTGGAGFIGSHLVQQLIAQNREVHVIDNLSTGNANRVPPDAVLHILDICSPEANSMICSIKPDIVFHLAAQANVQRSIRNPILDMEINIRGTLNILDACRKASVRKIIFASTSGVYGNLQKELITEEDPADPISFYGLSKLVAEQYIRLYEGFTGLPYTILRFGNVYGPGQTADTEGGVVAIFIKQLMEAQPLTINGDGEQSRDFIYVEDVVQANIAAIERGNLSTLNISTGNKTTVNRLIELLRTCHPQNIRTRSGPAKEGEIRHSSLSNKNAALHLQWQPQFTIEQGIKHTYKKNQADSL